MQPNALPARLIVPAVALLLIAAVAVGYQVASAQTSPGSIDDAPAAPTGLTATHDGVGVMLAWDDPDDDSIAGYRVWRRYHRDSHEDAARPPVDDELQLHVRHTGSSKTTSTTATSWSTRPFTDTPSPRSAPTARKERLPTRSR